MRAAHDEELLSEWLIQWALAGEDDAAVDAVLTSVGDAHRDAVDWTRSDDRSMQRIALRTIETVTVFYERITSGVVDDVADQFVRDVETWRQQPPD